MLPIAGLAVAQGALSAGTGIFSAISGHNQATAQARAQNRAKMQQYKQQLRIQRKNWEDTRQLYATKLGQHSQNMMAADRAASRAYGVEDLKQSQRIKKAAFASQKLDLALAKSGGAAAAAGKSGRSAERSDRNIESAFVRNQAMLTANLLEGDIASDYRRMGIQDQLQSARNRSYSQVAIAPMKPMQLKAPTQLDGPGKAGLMMGIGKSVLGGVMTGMKGIAPNIGDMGGGGMNVPDPVTNMSGQWLDMSNYVANSPYGY